MSFTDPPTKRAGDSWSSADNNTYVRDNFAALLPNGFTAVGELPVGSGTGTGGLLSIGTNLYYLVADSAQALGVKYAITPSRDLIAAKGDLLLGTGSKAVARLAVGTDTHVLVASMAQSSGWRWIPTNAIVARATATVTTTDQAWSTVTSSSDVYDPDTAFASGVYTVPSGKDGVYLVAFEFSLQYGYLATVLKAKVCYSSGAGEVLVYHRQSNSLFDGLDTISLFGAAIVPGVAGATIYPQIYQYSGAVRDCTARIVIAHLV